jgi:hypothetical protein
MRKSMTAVIAIALFIFPIEMYAGCPSFRSGACCGTAWEEYDFDASCAGISGSVATPVGTDSCSDTAYQFTGSGTITYSYTIG